MKKLLLTSTFSRVAGELKAILPATDKRLRAVFVPTAGDMYDEKPWMDADRKALVDLGLDVTDLSIKGKSKPEIERALENVDIIFVAGGNTFYLLDEARKSGFAELLPKFVESGIIYVGSSAGSYIACPTIEAAGWKNQDKNIVGLTDLSAMNLVPFLLFAHYNPGHDELLKQEIPKIKYPIRILNDDQAILVSGEEYKFVGRGSEVKIV